jgi:hypothetical protein
MSNLTTSKAAAEVLELVNSRPNTPRPEEIETIIARAAAPAANAMYRLAEWDRRLSEWHRATNASTTDEEATLADSRLIDFCLDQWRRPSKSWDDIALRAAIAKHWVWPNFDPCLSGDFSELLSRAKVKERCAMDEQSVAHLLKGIATLLGRPLELPHESETGGPRLPAQEAARHG